ncbi:MAG: Rhs element Vgr protein, partial [Planctomyces sp.]
VISREFQLLAASITHLANRISRATLVYQDGDPGKGDFRLCSAGVLAPGQTVSISVVAGGVSQKLFEGLTVRQSVRVREHGGSQLTVDCRHAAVQLTAGRRLGVSTNVRDADIASRLLKRAGVPCEVRGLTL